MDLTPFQCSLSIPSGCFRFLSFFLCAIKSMIRISSMFRLMTDWCLCFVYKRIVRTFRSTGKVFIDELLFYCILERKGRCVLGCSVEAGRERFIVKGTEYEWDSVIWRLCIEGHVLRVMVSTCRLLEDRSAIWKVYNQCIVRTMASGIMKV